MKSSSFSAFLAVALVALAGCGKSRIDRIEWPVMGTVAAVQTRFADGDSDGGAKRFRRQVQETFSRIQELLDAHRADSELSRLAPLDDSEVIACSSPSVRACYEAAFKLAKASRGAFNPRWRGKGTLDFGAIAKGFALDTAAAAVKSEGKSVLLDLGGNLKAIESAAKPLKPWKTGIFDPNGAGFAAKVDLYGGEALATSATNFRGRHIRDGRTGNIVSNGVASVTVKCRSAMWADALSTTLFVLGPGEGRRFLDAHQKDLTGEDGIFVFWIMEDGRKIKW